MDKKYRSLMIFKLTLALWGMFFSLFWSRSGGHFAARFVVRICLFIIKQPRTTFTSKPKCCIYTVFRGVMFRRAPGAVCGNEPSWIKCKAGFRRGSEPRVVSICEKTFSITSNEPRKMNGSVEKPKKRSLHWHPWATLEIFRFWTFCAPRVIDGSA